MDGAGASGQINCRWERLLRRDHSCGFTQYNRSGCSMHYCTTSLFCMHEFVMLLQQNKQNNNKNKQTNKQKSHQYVLFLKLHFQMNKESYCMPIFHFSRDTSMDEHPDPEPIQDLPLYDVPPTRYALAASYNIKNCALTLMFMDSLKDL